MTTQENHLPLVGLAGMGGTIVMRDEGDGLVPSLAAEDMLASIPELAGTVRVTSTTICHLGSSVVGFDDLRATFAWARDAVVSGATAVVVTHGTDTLEETAFLLDLWWDLPEPIVVTGAMRSPAESGADGPANLLAAVRVALAPASRDQGVLAVLNDEILPARGVAKARTFGTDAFRSTLGPLGRVVEGQVEYALRPARPRPAPLPVPEGTAWVPIVSAALGEDARALDALLDAGADGVVVAGVGAGHVSRRILPAIDRAVAAGVPVVVASRTGAGRTARSTYGFEGGEIDLQRRGAVMAGRLNPTQARLLLWTLVSSEMSDRATLVDAFDR